MKIISTILIFSFGYDIKIKIKKINAIPDVIIPELIKQMFDLSALVINL